MKKISVIIALLAFLPAFIAGAKVRLPSLMGNGMVLQRETMANIWGWALPDKNVAVTVSWDGMRYETVSGKDGAWCVSVRTPGAGGPYTIAIDDGDMVILDDVLIGEVWLCSGQSNMEMPVKGFDSQPVYGSLQTILEAPSHCRIRLFHTSRNTSSCPLDDCTGQWQVSSMESASGFSAAAYYFALHIEKALGIPVGMIESDWGATRIEAWMSEKSALSVNPDVMSTNQQNDGSNQVAALYNAMIVPLSGYTIRGFIWYQGESNKGFHKTYPANMAAMVSDWRSLWGGGEQMPFYYVQLAPFDYDIPMHRFEGQKNGILLPLMVEAQLKALSLIPNSGMAATTDTGSATDIHPARKDVVGQRLALLALTGTYGMSGIDSSGPVYRAVAFRDGKAFVTMESQSTLYPIDVPLHGFEIAGEDRVFHPAEAYVVHDGYDFSARQVEVWSPEVGDPVAVRYAFRNVTGPVNLINTIGLPAFPFRTDDWDNVDPVNAE